MRATVPITQGITCRTATPRREIGSLDFGSEPSSVYQPALDGSPLRVIYTLPRNEIGMPKVVYS